MQAEEFGMWALATMAWALTVYSAVWAHAFVRDQQYEFWFQHQMRLRHLDKIDSGQTPIDFYEED